MTTSIPTIRPFAADEWRRWRDLRLRAIADTPDAFAVPLAAAQARDDDTWASLLAQASASPHDLPLLAEVDGQPAGLAWAQQDGDTVWLYQVFVTPACRGRGVAQALLRRAIEWARARGATEVKLGATVSVAPARRLYLGMGFEDVGAPVPMADRDGLMEQTMRLAPA